MDVETIEALEALRGELAGVEERLTERMDGPLRREIADSASALREGILESRTQMKVLIESLQDDVRMVADGVAQLTAKVDGLRR